MLRVGITGGIGSGKTAVSDYLETLGVTVLDADRYAHQVTARGQDAVTEIATLLGPAVIDADGHLDRAAVRELVFTNPKKRAALESIVHPRVRHEMIKAASQASGPYVIFSIPLMCFFKLSWFLYTCKGAVFFVICCKSIVIYCIMLHWYVYMKCASRGAPSWVSELESWS